MPNHGSVPRVRRTGSQAAWLSVVPKLPGEAPIVIGAAGMPYATFLTYSIIGGALWISSMVLAGYFLGGLIENALGIKLEDHIEKVVIVVVLISLLPPIIEFLKHKFSSKPDVIDDATEVVEK